MKLIKPALVGILTTTSLLGTAIPAFAAEDAKSDGHVQFVEVDTESPDIVAPPVEGGEEEEKPEGELTPGEDGGGNETGQTGPLTIDYVSNFNFGEIEYNIVKGATQKALLDVWEDEAGSKFYRPNMVQVTDIRPTNPGWTLKVTQEGQFETDEEKELRGATITFNEGITTENHDGFQKPNASGSTLELNEATKIAWADAADEEEGDISKIMGKGSSSIIFSEGVELYVPKGTPVEIGESYTTELTWTLENTPSF